MNTIKIKEFLKSSKVKLALCIIFLLGVVLGSAATTYINILNNKTIQHKIEKGEIMHIDYSNKH